MNRVRRIAVAGLGAMTPALIATDQAEARSVDRALELTQSAPTVALEQEALKTALLELSPTEKLRIAGDRIRISMEAQPSRRGPSTGYIVSMTNPVQKCTVLRPEPKKGPAIAPPKAPANGPVIGPTKKY